MTTEQSASGGARPPGRDTSPTGQAASGARPHGDPGPAEHAPESSTTAAAPASSPAPAAAGDPATPAEGSTDHGSTDHGSTDKGSTDHGGPDKPTGKGYPTDAEGQPSLPYGAPPEAGQPGIDSAAANASKPDTKDGTATGSDAASGDSRTGDSRTEDGKTEDSKTEDSKTEDSKTEDSKTEDSKEPTGGDGEGKDRWAAFGPAPESAPKWYGRLARRSGRLLIHEWTLAALGSLALAVLMTWPTLRYPRHTLPQDYWDPSLQAWQMAWSGHILRTDPSQLWHANAFYPERWSFAFSDTLLGYAPAGLIGNGPGDALLRYNIMFVLAHALATFGAYVLARQLGASRIGSAVAGVSYTYAPWLLAQAGHLHVVSNGGIPLALAMLARGHGWSLRHGYRPERRSEGWVYAGWLVAAWQLSLGFGIGLPFAYVLAGTVLVATLVWYAKRIFWRVKRPFGQRLFAADLVGGLIFAGVGVLLALPYFTVTQLHPQAERTIGDIAGFSPPLSGFVTAPAESRIWGGLHEGARSILPWHPEMTLLPGFALYALAAGGLFFSIWTVRQRLFLLAGVLVAMTLSMGTRFFGGHFTYEPLFEFLPGWNGIRTPGRLMLWATLLLGLLAAGAVSAFAERVREISAERIPSWPSPWLRLATLVPLLLVVAEGTNTTPHPVVPPQPAAMRTVDGPLLVLPSGQNRDQPVMLWSTTRFQQVVNGGSGFTPRQLADVRRVTMTFPDQTSVDYLRTLGVQNVLVMRDQIVGTPWEVSVDAPLDGLGITREELGSVVAFRL
ncbi:hypothetical protein [Micromonospora radicis]|uniref:hypothetical protein n=1 Tax=Micromonospora radicis TaxID=1894971 RepID=UPI001F20D518|nr:hypothetical protein [Micromonospora radicis]